MTINRSDCITPLTFKRHICNINFIGFNRCGYPALRNQRTHFILSNGAFTLNLFVKCEDV